MKIQNKFWVTGILFIILSANSLWAQVMVGGIEEYIDYANINYTNAANYNTYENIKGSPFIFKNFKIGQIKLDNGKVYEGLLRYDIYADQIEFKTKKDEIFAVLNQKDIDKVMIGEMQLIYIENIIGDLEPGIFEVAGTGDFLLLTKHIVELKDAIPAKPYIEAKPATFVVKNNKYLIITPDGDFVEIKNKKDLILIGTKRSVDVDNYIKKNKIKISDKESLTKYVDYLNSL